MLFHGYSLFRCFAESPFADRCLFAMLRDGCLKAHTRKVYGIGRKRLWNKNNVSFLRSALQLSLVAPAVPLVLVFLLAKLDIASPHEDVAGPSSTHVDTVFYMPKENRERKK